MGTKRFFSLLITTMTRITRTTRRPAAATIRAKANAADPADLSKLGTFPAPTATSEQLAVENLLLASDRARKFVFRNTNMQHLAGDLEAVAWTGLLNACRRYTPDIINPSSGKPYRISTYAVRFIDGAMFRFLRDRGHPIRFPNAWREAAPRARREIQQNKKTLEQAAAIVGMDPQDVAEMVHAMGPTNIIEDDQFQRPDPLDDLSEEAERFLVLGEKALRKELNIAMDAIAVLGDDGILIHDWWTLPRRRGMPTGPLQQFWRRVDRIRRGLPQEPTIQQATLADDPGTEALPLTTSPEQAARILSSRAELLGVMPAGKLKQEPITVDGAGETGSPNG